MFKNNDLLIVNLIESFFFVAKTLIFIKLLYIMLCNIVLLLNIVIFVLNFRWA